MSWNICRLSPQLIPHPLSLSAHLFPSQLQELLSPTGDRALVKVAGVPHADKHFSVLIFLCLQPKLVWLPNPLLEMFPSFAITPQPAGFWVTILSQSPSPVPASWRSRSWSPCVVASSVLWPLSIGNPELDSKLSPLSAHSKWPYLSMVLNPICMPATPKSLSVTLPFPRLDITTWMSVKCLQLTVTKIQPWHPTVPQFSSPSVHTCPVLKQHLRVTFDSSLPLILCLMHLKSWWLPPLNSMSNASEVSKANTISIPSSPYPQALPRPSLHNLLPDHLRHPPAHLLAFTLPKSLHSPLAFKCVNQAVPLLCFYSVIPPLHINPWLLYLDTKHALCMPHWSWSPFSLPCPPLPSIAQSSQLPLTQEPGMLFLHLHWAGSFLSIRSQLKSCLPEALFVHPT